MADQVIEWLNSKQTAAALHISVKTLQNWQAKRLIPYFKIGRSVRFKLADVQAHLNSKCLVAAR